ncbi:MAG: hypothetical protein AB2392_03120 [Neobacillus sp.]
MRGNFYICGETDYLPYSEVTPHVSRSMLGQSSIVVVDFGDYLSC